ncbi:MAG: GNAT superfamily N-acetyltransferase [Myxococcota bacterium]
MSPSDSILKRLELRPARPGDVAEAIRIQLAAFEGLTQAAWGAWDAEKFEGGMREDWCEAETRGLWLDNALIGFVRLAHRSTYDWLDLVVVAVPHQGMRIGSAVLNVLIAEAQQRGVSLWLSVYRINPARRLYSRHGFSARPRDPVRILMGHPADAVPPPELLTPGPERG